MLELMFPEIVEKKKKDSVDEILYLFLFDFGWTYEEFKETPIPIIFRMVQKHTEKIKKQNKK